MTTCAGPRKRCAEAAKKGAQIVCLPELFRTQYFCQRKTRPCSIWPRPFQAHHRRAGVIAREEKVVVVTSVFERRTRGLYHNTAAVLATDGTITGIYRKMHIPDDPLYYEKYYFTPETWGSRPSIRSLPASAR